MAKTKYIVPAVAMLLCAVSLIGAGYAAYTATLADTENATVENDYTTPKIGTHTVNSKAFIEYNSASTSANGAAPTTTYTGIAKEETLLTFTVDADTKGTVDTVNAITLTSLTFTPPTGLTNYFSSVTLKVCDNTGATVNAGGVLTEGAQYTVKLVLATPIENVATAPAVSVDLTYTINISDSVTAPTP